VVVKRLCGTPVKYNANSTSDSSVTHYIISNWRSKNMSRSGINICNGDCLYFEPNATTELFKL
jgi:hypothetical protein